MLPRNAENYEDGMLSFRRDARDFSMREVTAVLGYRVTVLYQYFAGQEA